jgi:hypothetical protein
MMISPDAKVVDLKDLQIMIRERMDQNRKISTRIYGENEHGFNLKTYEMLTDAEKEVITRINCLENIIQDDPGRFATMMGYDAIRIPTPNVNWRDPTDLLPDTFYAVLNRGAVAVRDTALLVKAKKKAPISFKVKKAYRG